MEGRLQLSAEGEMFGDEKEYDKPPKALDLIGNVELTKEAIELKVEGLKRWFYVDGFQMFTDLVRTNKAPLATYHLWQMAGEKATLLSPAIETHSKYLEIVDERMMGIEIRAGRGPFDPQKMENIIDIVLSNINRPIRSIGVKPVFIGQLAQAQKVSQALEPIQRTMQAVTPLMQVFPTLKFMYREYETANDINEAMDFPQKNIVPKEEYDEAVKQYNEAQAQQQQIENSIEMAKAAKGVSGKVEPDSVLGALAGAGK